MNSRRMIICYWVLLIVPAVIVSGVAATFLRHEQERINTAAVDTMTRQARSIARTVHMTVEEVENRLARALLEIDRPDLTRTLLTWEETNPLVRNVFIWDPVHLLEYPVRGMASTREERQFIRRFEALFSKEVRFESASPGSQDGSPPEKAGPGNTGSRRNMDTVYPVDTAVRKPAISARESLYDLARAGGGTSGPAMTRNVEPVPVISGSRAAGWIPWFSQNRLHILGWVKSSSTGRVYGMELELVCLLSRLVTDLPVIDEKGVGWALLDSRHQVVHQSGTMVKAEMGEADIRVPLSDLLPHWEIAVYLDREVFSPGRGFVIVSGLLLCIFMAAIISGGVLLTRQANRQMQEAMQKTSFVSSASHELKTPLTSIRMYAELLLTGRVSDPEKQKQYLTVMVAESQRLTRLINNVLDFAKLEQGLKTYQKTAVDIRQMIRRLADIHGIRIRNAGFEMAIQIGPGDYTARIDPDALEQVVLNLVDNALKYAAEGKFIAFELETDHPEDYGVVTLKICDKGPGVPAAHRESIFKKFYRIDYSLTAVQPGSGLGLSIARQILMDMGGDLFYESRPEGGCFVARIKK